MPTEKTAKKKPQRTCIACRQMLDKRELCRVVRTPTGEIVLDDTGKLAGRGAYLCRNLACLQKAFKSRAHVGQRRQRNRNRLEWRKAHRRHSQRAQASQQKKYQQKNLHGVQSVLRQNFFIPIWSSRRFTAPLCSVIQTSFP